MPSTRNNELRDLWHLFQMDPNRFPGVNPGVFSQAANEEIADDTARYKAQSPEMNREQSVLGAADQRAEIGIRGQLQDAADEYEAQRMGYDNAADAMNVGRQHELMIKTGPARIQAAGQIEASKNAAEAKASALEQMLQVAAAGGGNRSMSVAGVGTIGAPKTPRRTPQPSPSVLNTLGKAKAASDKTPLAGNPLTRMLGISSGPSAEAKAFEQAKANALQGINPYAVETAKKIAQRFPDMDLISALDQLGEDSLTEDEVQQVANALYVVRGH